MSELKIEIVGMTWRSFSSGRGQVLANFDVHLVGFMMLQGCSLSLHDTGKFQAYGPSFAATKPAQRNIRVSILDQALRARITAAAVEYYRAKFAHHFAAMAEGEPLTRPDQNREDQAEDNSTSRGEIASTVATTVATTG